MKQLKIIVTLLFCIIGDIQALLVSGDEKSQYIIDDQEWAWAHMYRVSRHEAKQASRKKVLMFEKIDVSMFTQLIPAWNGMRPLKGSFSIYARIRNASTKVWDQWHKVADWDAKGQKSYFSRGAFSCFQYARLELNDGIMADGFSLKIESNDDADVGLIAMIGVSTSNKHLFISEPYKRSWKEFPSLYKEGVPCISQRLVNHPRDGAICSPTAVTVFTGTFFDEPDVLDVANYVYDKGLNIFGNWMFNTAQAYISCKTQLFFYPMRLKDFSALYELLKKGFPVVLSIRGSLTGAAKSYPHGHLLVVVGWDSVRKKVICHDSAFKELERVEVAYDIYDFLSAWEASFRLVYKPLFIV